MRARSSTVERTIRCGEASGSNPDESIAMGMRVKQVIAVSLAVVVVVNFLLLLFRKIDLLAFWFLTAVFAVAAYVVLPRMK